VRDSPFPLRDGRDESVVWSSLIANWVQNPDTGSRLSGLPMWSRKGCDSVKFGLVQVWAGSKSSIGHLISVVNSWAT
jgi:hypothetical protein